MSINDSQEAGTRARTRAAILDAAAAVFAVDRAATLPDVAAAAGVGRTTLHRYFADRETLLQAVALDSFHALNQVFTDSRLPDVAPMEGLRRVVAGMVAIGDRVVFLFGDPSVLRRLTDWPTEDPVIELIKRGQAQAMLDPGVDPAWIQHVLWALVLRGCQDASRGELPRHSVTATVIRTLENGIRAR